MRCLYELYECFIFASSLYRGRAPRPSDAGVVFKVCSNSRNRQYGRKRQGSGADFHCASGPTGQGSPSPAGSTGRTSGAGYGELVVHLDVRIWSSGVKPRLRRLASIQVDLLFIRLTRRCAGTVICIGLDALGNRTIKIATMISYADKGPVLAFMHEFA